MTRHARMLLVLAFAAWLPACSTDDGPTCDLSGGTQLAAAPWPMFRADNFNSGRVDVLLDLERHDLEKLFPATDLTADEIGTVQVAPILGDDNIYLGASDGNVYVLNYDGSEVQLDFPILLPGPVTSTPLLGGEDGEDGEDDKETVLFVPTTGAVSQFELDRGLETGTALVIGSATGSLNIWNGDGTVFLATDGGVYAGVCPNSVLRYQVTFPPTQSTVAIAQDPTKPNKTPIIVAAGLNGQVRAYNIRSRQFWSFFASADINAAVLIDESTGKYGQFYVADAAGRVFAGELDTGRPVAGFQFPRAAAGILASMALGRDDTPTPRLYVADQSGAVYAVNRMTGRVEWTFQAAGPIRASLAVATGGDNDVIIVAADIAGGPNGEATAGRVYALSDLGCSGDACRRVEWAVDIEYSLGAAAPSIGATGIVYLGREGNQLNAENSVVNKGGALYAIGGS